MADVIIESENPHDQNAPSASGSRTYSGKAIAPPTLRMGFLAATCVASALTLEPASAQTNNNQLPALTVNAPAIMRAPRVQRPRAAKKRVRSRPAAPRHRARQIDPAQSAPASPAQENAGASSSGAQGRAQGAAPDSNPYANPSAPYNVQRSSSNKITEPLLDTPRTVTAIPKEVIADKGATSFRELVRTQPGLTLGTGEGGNAFGDRVFVRGFDTRNDVYVDGVRDPGVSVRETFQYEQVEILKGPAGVIGGRGTAGGAINLVTKKPFFQNYHEAEFTLGTAQTRRVTFDVNRVISPTLAIRATGMGQLADTPGRDFVFDNRWGGLIAVLWKPSDRFTMNLDYQHVDLDQLPDWGVPFDNVRRRPFTESGLRRENYYGIPGRDFQKVKQDIASASFEVKLMPWLTATNKFRVGRSLLDYVVGVPGTPDRSNPDPALWTVTSGAKSRYQINEVRANQTDLTAKFATFSLQHTLVGGVELSRESVYRDAYAGLDTESFGVINIPGVSLNLWNPVAPAWTIPLQRRGAPTTVTVDTVSTYLLDTINWKDKILVTVGIRNDNYNIGATSLSTAGVKTTLGRKDNIWNWNTGITYKIVPNGAVYVAMGTSSNPVGAELDGGGNDYGGLTVTNATLGPERNTAKEIGTKWEFFNRKLLVTAALFETTKDNARETVGGGAAATVQATGRYRIRGIELGIGGNITERWSVFGGVVVMDSKVLESANPANVGLKLANLAHTSFNLLSKYRITDEFTLGGQVTFKSDINGGTLAANQNVAPGRWRYDAFAEYAFTEKISGKLAIYNITNAVIYDAFYRSGTPFVYLAPGRLATASLKFKF